VVEVTDQTRAAIQAAQDRQIMVNNDVVADDVGFTEHERRP
jgi:hypothetical protein